MKRHESRKISRNRKHVQAMDPCNRTAPNPFAYLFQKQEKQLVDRSKEDVEKATAHQLKMLTDKKSAKARQQRKRNKV